MASKQMIRAFLGIGEFIGRLGCGTCGSIFVLATVWWGHALFYSLVRWFELAVGVGLVYIAVSPSRIGLDRVNGIVILVALTLVIVNGVWSLSRVHLGQAEASELILATIAAVSAVVATLARFLRR